MILRNDPVILKNKPNGHYRKLKADNRFHFPNFITALSLSLLSSSFSPLYLLYISLVMSVKVRQLTAPDFPALPHNQSAEL